MHVIRVLVILLMSSLLSGCAQIASPAGGKKDQSPPSFVKATPDQGATGVRPSTIRIFFDEFIQLQNTRQNVLLSPPIRGYDLIRRKRSVEVKLPVDSLRDSTTHTIQFGSAIKDITEGNALKGFEYVFSTGTSLDSLSLKGTVEDAYNLDSITNASILLYRAENDETVQNSRPYYYTEVGDEGKFDFQYLQEGKYLVYALKDLNNNLRFDPGEKIAFKPEPVNLEKDTTLTPLRLFQQRVDSAKVVKATNPYKGRVNVTFNQKIDTFTVRSPDLASVFWQLDKEGKEGEIFFEPIEKDSITFFLRLNKVRDDTASIQRSLKEGEDLGVDSNLRLNIRKNKRPVGSPFQVYANLPLAEVVDSSIGYFKDSTFFKKSVKGRIKGVNQKVLEITGPFKADSTYNLVLDSGAVIDIYGNKSGGIKKNFKVKPKDEYGLIGVNVTVPTGFPSEGNVILEIWNKEGERVRRKSQKKGIDKFKFSSLVPGTYRIKGILDANGNGFWDEGDLFTKELPEDVMYYDQRIKVKPNWEMRDIEFDLRR